jgi:NAD(P)-dependent dehydrogenase (short-subunit alcohol dehydrogenase family)
VAALGVAAYAAGKRRRRMSFRSKNVVITGGSRGLGLVLARRFAAEGARVALLARDEHELAVAADELRARGAHVDAVICDLRDEDEAGWAVREAAARLGGVDVLVNNAGTITVGPLDDMSLEDFRDAVDLHLWAPLRTSMAAIPFMRRAGGGRIVNIASIGGKVAFPHLLPYTASKFALVGLSEGLQAELRRDGILVTTVCPGLMRTGSPRNALFKGHNRKEYAWFAVGDSLPVLSVGAERAARAIVEACRRGKPLLTIGATARLAAVADELFPGLVARASALANRLLPDPAHRPLEAHHGRESGSAWAPSLLTRLSDRAAARNNERPTAHRHAEL